MNMLDLIEELRKKSRLTKSQAETIVKTFFDSTTDSLAKGDRVEIRGLWSFYVKEYEGYTGRNPKTGEQVQIKPKKLPYFKPGKELMKRVDI